MSSIRNITASSSVPDDLAKRLGPSGVNEILLTLWQGYYDLIADTGITISENTLQQFTHSIPLAVIVSKTHIVLIMLRKRTEIEIELLLIYRKYLFFLIYIITQKSRVRHPLHDFFLFCAGMS